MIKDRDELVEYLRGWGCPERELDEVINLYFCAIASIQLMKK